VPAVELMTPEPAAGVLGSTPMEGVCMLWNGRLMPSKSGSSLEEVFHPISRLAARLIQVAGVYRSRSSTGPAATLMQTLRTTVSYSTPPSAVSLVVVRQIALSDSLQVIWATLRGPAADVLQAMETHARSLSATTQQSSRRRTGMSNTSKSISPGP